MALISDVERPAPEAARRSMLHVAAMISFCAVISAIDLIAGHAAEALALRRDEFLRERPHLEEEHVAAGFARPLAPPDVARAGVVGDDVARLHLQVLGREHVRRVFDCALPADFVNGTTFGSRPATK